MEDTKIIELYWARQESAIRETDRKYGNYCRGIARNILQNREDSEECVNDTYLNAWRAMPPHRPERLAAFLGKITRNLSLNRWESRRAEKRGGGQLTLAIEELGDCLPREDFAERLLDKMELAGLLDQFLAALDRESRRIFMRRYWYFSPVKEIAADFGLSESKVKTALYRMRNRLKALLEKEGVAL